MGAGVQVEGMAAVPGVAGGAALLAALERGPLARAALLPLPAQGGFLAAYSGAPTGHGCCRCHFWATCFCAAAQGPSCCKLPGRPSLQCASKAARAAVAAAAYTDSLARHMVACL